MNKKFEPFLAHSELTDCIYIIDKDDKYEVTEQCIKAMKATNRMPKWIPVSEEPKEQGSYITTIKYGDKYAVGQRYYHGKYVGWEDSCVIAYMPLPESYKEDDNGE